MDIVIIAHFITEFVREGTSRFVYLAEQLSQSHNVEIITSKFDMPTKRQERSMRNAPVSTYTAINTPP